jgi:hypothetical protein
MQPRFKKTFTFSMLAIAILFIVAPSAHAQQVYAPIVDDVNIYQDYDNAYQPPVDYYQDNDTYYNYIAPHSVNNGYAFQNPSYKNAPNVYSNSKEIWDYNTFDY